MAGLSLFLVKAGTRREHGGDLPLEMCCSISDPQHWKARLEGSNGMHRLGRNRVKEVALYYAVLHWQEVKDSLDDPRVQLRPELR